MQYKISDSEALFSCSALILEMACLDTLFYALRDIKPGFVLSLFLDFYQNQGFCSHEIVLRKKSVVHLFKSTDTVILLTTIK